MEHTCKSCRKWLPLTAEYFEADPSMASGLRSSCRKCRNVRKRQQEAAARRAKQSMSDGHDPHMLVMVGAAMRMWKGPVNRDQPMRWRVAA